MKIQEYRKEHHMTISALSERSGLSKRTIEDIIRRDDCLVSNAMKIAKALDVSLDALCEK